MTHVQPATAIPVIVGATASGKSRLACRLADAIGARIISVDSRKIYRRLDIGSAKPSPEVIARYNYGMIDVVDPDEQYSAYQYARAAVALIEQTIASDRIPLLVGGTGFYLRALKDGLFDGPDADPEIREEIERSALATGWKAVYEKLQEVDPETASHIDPHNKVRLTRALEVYYLTGTPISALQRSGGYQRPPWKFLLFGIDLPRAQLYDNIGIRTELMVKRGLFDEVRSLLDSGIGSDAPGLRTVGYAEVLDYLVGKTDQRSTIEKIKINTRHYAKRQLTWFRRQEKVSWLTPGENMVDLIQAALV